MEIKMIELRNCGECPYGKYVNFKYNLVNYLCELMNKMTDIEGIHSDCPLKDKCEKGPNMYEVVCK